MRGLRLAKKHRGGIIIFQGLYYDTFRCGNVAAIFELDEHLMKSYPIFEAAPNVSCTCIHSNAASNAMM